MSFGPAAGLVLVFAVVFSFAGLPGPLARHYVLPTVPLAYANLPPMQPWYPAGPAMDTLVYKFYVDENAEFTGLQAGEIDLTDWPLTPSLVSSLASDPNYFVTAPISDTGYFELQFHLAANFWGCEMNFGNSACGRDIRQGIAHALDKVKFTSLQAAIAGASVPIDNPVPPAVDLVLPNPCGWDATHVQTGSSCVVGENGLTGGIAYHLAPAVACGTTVCTSTPTRPWTPGFGTPDFCAAADHFIAAGLATGKVSGTTDTCKLTGISSAVTANPVNMFIRSDSNPRYQAGTSVEEFICALLGSGFVFGCPGVTHFQGPVTAFPGFYQTCATVCLSWDMYTAYVNDIPTSDRSLYFDYHSRFVSGIPTIKQSGGGPCSNDAVGSYVPANYMFLCNQTYDDKATQSEFAPCLTAPGDPTNGQVVPTFANCVSDPTKLSAKSASYQAQDVFGQNAFTVPWFSLRSQFAYRSNWQRVVLHQGDGLVPPGNILADFNAWSPTPAVAGTIRQGYKEPPLSLNPYVARTQSDLGIIGNIFDQPSRINPASPQSTLDWMVLNTRTLPNSILTYVPSPGTVDTLRYTLRDDIYWQTGQKVTAWDLAFSYISLRATGVYNGAGLAPMTGVKVLSRNVVDINLNGLGPFTQQSLSAFVLPGRFWSACGAANWDAGASNTNFAMANAALTPCIGPNLTSSGVVLPSASAVDSSKILPAFDPAASGILVGSGPWECRSSSGVVGTGCTPPPGALQRDTDAFARYGFGFAPGTSLISYFRSSGNLALWAWSGNTGDFSMDFLNFGVASLCFGTAPPLPSPCNRWTMGIGNPTGSAGSPALIGLVQVGVVARLVGVNWVSPYNWVSSPPQGIASFPPVLYEGSATLNPASVVGCMNSFNNGGGYDC